MDESVENDSPLLSATTEEERKEAIRIQKRQFAQRESMKKQAIKDIERIQIIEKDYNISVMDLNEILKDDIN